MAATPTACEHLHLPIQAGASQLLRELKGEPMTLLQRYLDAMGQLMFAVEQAITEAIERPVTGDQ